MNNFKVYLRHRFLDFFIGLSLSTIGLFSTGKLASIPEILLFYAAVSFFMFHILMFNDWGGLQINPSERQRFNLISNQSKKDFDHWLLIGSVVSIIVSIGLFSTINVCLALVAFLGLGISVLYSHPFLRFKEKFLGSNVVHLIGGETQFLFGYLVSASNLYFGLLSGLFFALIFVAGHCVHECIHIREDKKGDIQTSAVKAGVLWNIKMAMIIFWIGHFYLFFLKFNGFIPGQDLYIYQISLIVHAYYSLSFWQKKKISREQLLAYRGFYRLTYGISTLGYIILKIT